MLCQTQGSVNRINVFLERKGLCRDLFDLFPPSNFKKVSFPVSEADDRCIEFSTRNAMPVGPQSCAMRR